jgi:hypothetical protein
LRSPDRFTSIDPELFLDPEITSREYTLRYGEDVVHDENELIVAMGVEQTRDIEEVLFSDEDFDGEMVVHPSGVELIVGRRGIGLEYPFRVVELYELVVELGELYELEGNLDFEEG